MNLMIRFRMMMIQRQTYQMLTKFKNIIGGIAALLGVFAFSYFYYSLKSLKADGCTVEEFEFVRKNLSGLFWISTCFIFSIFSGLLFSENRSKWVGSLYLLSFIFFGVCFLASLVDWIYLDKLRMSKVYWGLIASSILTIITYFYKWIKHNLF